MCKKMNNENLVKLIEQYTGKDILIHILRDEDDSENFYIQDALLYVENNKLIIEDESYMCSLLGSKIRIGLNKILNYNICESEFEIDTLINCDYGIIQINSFS